ncbi:MAG: hypothetical protein ABF868_03505 [Sporolactobacillus sp.]
MTAFWIVLNFVLVLLAFYMILHLYQRIRSLQEIRAEVIAKEMDTSFDTYINEIREENVRLTQDIQKLIQEVRSPEKRRSTRKRAATGSQPAAHPESSAPFRTILAEQTAAQKGPQATPRPAAAKPALESEWAPPIDGIQDQFETSPAAEALRLQQQGKSTKEIAKQLGRGEGEIELILKLQANRH